MEEFEALLRELEILFINSADALTAESSLVGSVAGYMPNKSGVVAEGEIGGDLLYHTREHGDEFEFTQLGVDPVYREVKSFGRGISIKREDAEDLGARPDLANLWRSQVTQLGKAYIPTVNREIVSSLLSMTYGDHGVRGNNQLAGTGTGAGQILTDVASAQSALMLFKGVRGEDIVGDLASMTVVAPVALRATILNAFGATSDSLLQEHVKGMATKFVFHPALDRDSATDFYVLNTTGDGYPLTVHERQAARLLVEPPDSGQAFERNVYRIRSDARLLVSDSAWFRAVKVNNA